MEVVTLKNGTQEAKQLVAVVMMSINGLVDEGLGGALALYDLAKMAEPGSTYQPFGKNGDTLRDLNLIDADNNMHDSIKNIVRSAVEFSDDGIDFSVVNPVKTEPVVNAPKPSTPGPL